MGGKNKTFKNNDDNISIYFKKYEIIIIIIIILLLLLLLLLSAKAIKITKFIPKVTSNTQFVRCQENVSFVNIQRRRAGVNLFSERAIGQVRLLGEMEDSVVTSSHGACDPPWTW